MTNLTRALALLLVPAAATAQPPAATKPADPVKPIVKPAEPVKPVEVKKEEPKPAPAPEPTDVKSYTFTTDAEYTDMVQQFAVLYAKMNTKPAAAPGQPAVAPKALKFTTVGRSKSVLVRGTKAELDAAEAVVKVIQGGTTGGTGPVVIKLKNTNIQEVMQAAAALELDAGLVALRGANAVVMLNPADVSATQVKKVIEACEKFDPKSAKPSVGGGD